MFNFFKKKKKPENVLDQFIFTVYGYPPPPKRADIKVATALAFEELLMGTIEQSEVSEQTKALSSGPIPYSTHDLALSVALNFFKQPECIPHLHMAQMMARLKMLEWLKAGYIVPVLAKSFEDTLYKLYKQ